jgi:hypothetical protein
MCSPQIRAQIRLLSQRDKIPADQIAMALNLPLELVERNLAETPQAAPETRTSRLVDLLADAAEEAAGTIKELAVQAENESVRANCAQYILDIVGGLKTPKTEESTPITQINIYMQQAGEAYARQQQLAKEHELKRAAEVLRVVDVPSENGTNATSSNAG